MFEPRQIPFLFVADFCFQFYARRVDSPARYPINAAFFDESLDDDETLDDDDDDKFIYEFPGGFRVQSLY